MTLFRTFLILIFSSYSLTAFAAPPSGKGGGGNRKWYVDLSLAPVLRNQNDGFHIYEGGGSSAAEGSVSTVKTFGYDLKTTAAYTFNSTWLAGLSYNLYSTSSSRSASAADTSQDSTTSINEYGPTLGALYSGWHFTFTYILASTFKYTDKQKDNAGVVQSDITSTLKDGSGFIFNFGYSFDLTDWLQIGPSLIYRSVSYKTKSRVDALSGSATDTFSNQTLATKAVQGSLSPFLSLTARF